MKKLFYISGALTLTFGILFLFGVLDFHHTTARALAKGNRLYAEESFTEALEAYNAGLQNKADHPILNYNAAQASFRLEAYDRAAELYGNAPASVDLYLNRGNSFLRLGDQTEDINRKLQHYASALETYKQGILAFPQNVELKFNYEYVLEKLKELQDDMENLQQNNRDDQESQEQNQQGQQNQNDNSQDQQNDRQGEQNEENSRNGQQGEQQNEENSRDDQQGSQSNPENRQENGQQQTGDQDDRQNSGNLQQEASGQDEQPSEPTAASGEEENPAGSSTDESAQNSSEIERILEMLEKQEEQALKNNQKVRNSGKEDEHDW